MKSNALDQLWRGQIAPSRQLAQDDPETAELAALAERNRELLERQLSGEQNAQLEKLLCCLEDYQDLLMFHAFRSGFSLAANLLLDAFAQDR